MHTKLPIPDWFTNTIAQGIADLASLQLVRTPSPDIIHDTLETWAKMLWANRTWSITADEERLKAAFLTLGTATRYWPAPLDLLEHLPTRQDTTTWRRRPEKPVSPEARAEIRGMVNDLVAKLDYADQLEREEAERKAEESRRRAVALRAMQEQADAATEASAPETTAEGEQL